MCRTIEGKIHGVLTDHNLSLWTASLTPNHSRTPQQKTGTPPFMANGLLKRTDRIHMYRHDMEFFFYIILILATH